MDIIDKLIKDHRLTGEEYIALLALAEDPSAVERLKEEACRLRRPDRVYGLL